MKLPLHLRFSHRLLRIARHIRPELDARRQHPHVDSPSTVWTGNRAPPGGLVSFEGRSSAQPKTYQARMFPQYIDALRADSIRNWDTKILRRFTNSLPTSPADPPRSPARLPAAPFLPSPQSGTSPSAPE